MSRRCWEKIYITFQTADFMVCVKRMNSPSPPESKSNLYYEALPSPRRRRAGLPREEMGVSSLI